MPHAIPDLVFGVYLALVTTVGIVALCKGKKTDEGLLGSRNLTGWLIGGTMIAVCAGDAVAANAPVQPKAEPFDLRAVQLLDGPFKHAQEVNHRLLLSMDLDRLLYPFRREAGISSPVRGRDELKFDFTGHSAGHFLTACALDYRSSGDFKLKKKADALVAALAECQAKMGNGFLGGFPEKSILELEGLVKDPSVTASVPWYCLHKIYAGLLDMYVLAGNQQALDVLQKAIDWVEKNTSQLSDEKMQQMLNAEHGGMNEVLANLYKVTRDKKHLRLAQRFNHLRIIAPFAEGYDYLDGHHANTQIPKFIGALRQHELTGDADLGRAARNFWTAVVADRTYVTGGNSYYERFLLKGHLSEFLGERTTESCNVYNMLKLSRDLFRLDPRGDYADYYERALINQTLSSRDPETGGQLYYQLLQSGNIKGQPSAGLTGWTFIFNDEANARLKTRDSVCCPATGLESNAKYGDSIYFHRGTRELYVNLFIASRVDWKANGVTLKQETRYPEEGATQLIFSCRKPVPFTLKIRHPWWATKEFQILVNGKRQSIASLPGSYAPIERTWANGDSVEVIMPMTLRMEGFKDNPKRTAVMYGPLVLAAISEQGNPFSVIVAEDGSFLNTLRPVEGRPLEFTAPPQIFRTSPVAVADQPVVFRPWYRLFNAPYAIYWDITSPEQFGRMAAQFNSELRLQQEWEPRTVDMVRCGRGWEMFTFQSMLAGKGWLPRSPQQTGEKQHGLKTSEAPAKPFRQREEERRVKAAEAVNAAGVPAKPLIGKTTARYVEFLASKMFFNLTGSFRALEPGEWCSYQLRVLPQEPQQLLVRLWKAPARDLGEWAQKQGRLQILVDRQLVGTCDVESLPAGRFFQTVCPLPPELLKDRAVIEVLLRVADDSLPVFGIYECRILQAK